MIKIQSKVDCCGCSACAQICPKSCIEMRPDSQGFLYPLINKDTCVDCGLCEKVCPIINPFEPIKTQPKSYVSRVYDNELRLQSSSGGLFTVLATHVIKKGGIVFGVLFDNEWNVKHDWTDNVEGLSNFRGSKYVQSKIGNSYKKAKEFLLSGRIVLFTGTPCQIAGLHHYLGRKYENLYSLDIVCHSVPSPLVWKKYLLEISGGDLSSINSITFRNKEHGWREYGLKIITDNCQVEGSNTQNTFMKGFLNDLYTRPSCSNCPARNYRSGSDLMLADSWGLNIYHPDWDDNKGMSLVLVKTSRGRNLIEHIKDNLFFQSVPYDEVEDRGLHAPIMLSCKPHVLRNYFYKRLARENTVVLIEKCLRYGGMFYNFIHSIKCLIKALLPMYFKHK